MGLREYDVFNRVISWKIVVGWVNKISTELLEMVYLVLIIESFDFIRIKNKQKYFRHTYYLHTKN